MFEQSGMVRRIRHFDVTSFGLLNDLLPFHHVIEIPLNSIQS
jgi:hypothetical protein